MIRIMHCMLKLNPRHSGKDQPHSTGMAQNPFRHLDISNELAIRHFH